MNDVDQGQVTVHAEFGKANAQFAAPCSRREQIRCSLVEVAGPELADRKVVRRDHPVVLGGRG